MKRNLIIALLMAIIAIPASAQLKWGVEAGLNMNKLTTKNMDDHKLGFFVGPKAQFSLLGVIVDGALQYSQCQYNDDNESFFVIPVNVKYAIGLGSLLSIYASTGPQWSWHIGNSHGIYKPHQLSWNVGAGVHVAKHFQVGVNYNIGCTDAVSSPSVPGIMAGVKAKNNIWQVRLAYMF